MDGSFLWFSCRVNIPFVPMDPIWVTIQKYVAYLESQKPPGKLQNPMPDEPDRLHVEIA